MFLQRLCHEHQELVICIGMFLHIKLFFKSLPTCITRKRALSRFLTSWQTYPRLLSSFILGVTFSIASMSSTWFIFMCPFIESVFQNFCQHLLQVNGFVSLYTIPLLLSIPCRLWIPRTRQSIEPLKKKRFSQSKERLKFGTSLILWSTVCLRLRFFSRCPFLSPHPWPMIHSP